MLYPVWHLRLQERQREAVDRSAIRSGQDKTNGYLLYRKSCAPSLALIPKRLDLPVSRGAGGHYSEAVVIPDVRRPDRVGDGHGRMQAT
jgi:hypothetical protein